MKYDYHEVENKRLASLLAHYPGCHLLQLGGNCLSSLTASPISHKIYTDSTSACTPATHTYHYSFLKSAYTHLPFASESINLVLLPHTLEVDKNAQLILAEAWRVLAPNGHLILLSINPISLWGLYDLFSFTKKPPWHGYFYTLQTICQWIQYLGGDIQHIESFLFRPPLSSSPGRWLFHKLSWLEYISPWLIPYMGGIYLIIAQKRVKKLSTLGLVWQFPPVLNNKILAPNTRGAHHRV